MTDELQPTAQDEADLAALNAPEVETPYIVNRMNAALFDSAPDPIAIVLAMGDTAFHTLIDENGCTPDSLAITMGRTVIEGEAMVEIVYSAERPAGWTAPESEGGE